jgi:hypothetical protein
MMSDPRAARATDPDVSHSSAAKTALRAAVADAEATLDPGLRAPTVTEATMEMCSVAIAEAREAVREIIMAVREVAREIMAVAREMAVKDTTTMIDLITTRRVEDLRLLVVVPGTTTTMMTIDLAKDTTIKIMTIPAKIELVEATKTMLAVDNPVNKIIKTIMITNLVTITEDPGETTTIKTIV